MKLIISIDRGPDVPIYQIQAEVDEANLDEALYQINKNGIHDKPAGIWFPSSKVLMVQYEPTP